MEVNIGKESDNVIKIIWDFWNNNIDLLMK